MHTPCSLHLRPHDPSTLALVLTKDTTLLLTKQDVEYLLENLRKLYPAMK